MAENIWYVTTDTEWITFNNDGSKTVTGTTGTGFSIQIAQAENYDDESVGYIVLNANGNETVKTITRCLPELLCRDSKIICDITYEEGDNELLPCKSNPIEDGRVTISNVKIETTDYYSMDNSWEEITDCDDKTVGCEKFECLSGIPESNVEGKTSSVDVASYSVLYRIEGETNYYTEVPSNSGSDRKILITLQANGMSRDIPEFYFTQKGTAEAQLDNVIICETGETSTRVEYENFYIEATNIPDNQYTWIGNMMSISAYSNAQITQDSPSGEFASFSKTVTPRKYIGAISGETCCEPKFNVIMDDGQVTDCNDTDCPKTYQFRVIGANISAQFNGETLIFEPNASHSEYKSVSVTAKLIDNLNNIQKDSYKTVTFILPPNTNGGGYPDIYLNAIISQTELAYNETSVSFKWFLTKDSSYSGEWKDGYADFNAIASVNGETDEAFLNAMINGVHIEVDNETYNPEISYESEYGVFHIDNFEIGTNTTNADKTIKLVIDDCFLAANSSKTVQAIQKKTTLYLHSYVVYNNECYYDGNWPTLPSAGGTATIKYFLSQIETIEYCQYNDDYIINELAYKNTTAIGTLDCTCATNETCDCEEDEKCTCSTGVTCGNATGTYIKKKEVTLPSTTYEDNKQTFKFTISCNGYVSPKTVNIIQDKAEQQVIQVFIEISDDYGTEKKAAVTLPGDSVSKFVLTYWATLNGQIVEANYYEDLHPGEETFDISNIEDAQTMADGKKQVKIHVSENNVNRVKQRYYKAVYNEIYSENIVVAMQNGRDMILLPNFDYMTFKYKWGDNDGDDLDTATFITGVNPNDPIYNELCTNYIGFAGISPGISAWRESQRRPLTGHSDNGEVVKFAEHGGDNTESGLECALLYWKNICSHDYITNGTNILYCDLYGIWYQDKRCNAECELEFKMFKNTSNEPIEQEFKKVDIDGRSGEGVVNTYGFAPNNSSIIQTGDTQIKSNIKVYANGGSLGGSLTKVKNNYTHLARFTYNVLSKETSFERITDGEKGYYLEIDGTCTITNQFGTTNQYQLSTLGDTIKYIYNTTNCAQALFKRWFDANETGEKILLDSLNITSFSIQGELQTIMPLTVSARNYDEETVPDWFTTPTISPNGELKITILSVNPSTTKDRDAYIDIAFSATHKISYSITQRKQTA